MLNRCVADKRMAGRRAPIGAELATREAVLISPFWQAVSKSQFWFALNSNLWEVHLVRISPHFVLLADAADPGALHKASGGRTGTPSVAERLRAAPCFSNPPGRYQW